jgi:hypothetical protein
VGPKYPSAVAGKCAQDRVDGSLEKGLSNEKSEGGLRAVFVSCFYFWALSSGR